MGKHSCDSHCSGCLLQSEWQFLLSCTFFELSPSSPSTLTNNKQIAYLPDCQVSLADAMPIGCSWGINA